MPRKNNYASTDIFISNLYLMIISRDFLTLILSNTPLLQTPPKKIIQKSNLLVVIDWGFTAYPLYFSQLPALKKKNLEKSTPSKTNLQNNTSILYILIICLSNFSQ